MFKNFLFILSIAGILSVSSCKYPDIPKSYEIRDKIKMEYAPYLKRTTEIHPTAAFQVQNKYRDVYYIIVPQAWKEHENYVDLLFDSLGKDLQMGVIEPYVYANESFENEKGYQVKEMRMSGKLKDKTLQFTLQLIQKDTLLYQTAGWYFKSKEDLWQKDIDAINASITILE